MRDEAPNTAPALGAELTTANPQLEPSTRRFGAFSGVFTPSILTILGVIMYLRLGWVTGQVGLLGALGIVLLSHVITLSVGLSVSSIATDRAVGLGGAYNIISRSLGVSTGAAIGIPLFLAQALSVTFYVVGFTESVATLLPWMNEKILGSVILLGLVAISARSAALAIKTQYVVMVAIGLSLVSIFMGSNPEAPAELEWTGAGTESFSMVFAVFFPAVTGIMAGVGMSGDLKDPRTALPRGTMSAILVGMAVYIAMPVWFATNYSSAELVANKDIAWDLATIPALVFLGVWGATLSSAVGSILTAPRTLQALAVDGLVPRLFARGSGPANEPVVGLIATFILAEAGILLGNLDLIAPILTMFFLATYGLINLACGLERWAKSPRFRPQYQVPAAISLVGALACFYVMSIISLPAMVIAVLVCALIFVGVERRQLDTTFGDARHGIWAALVRASLFRLKDASFHPGNWRPNTVIFGGDPVRRPWLLHFGSAIVQDRGIVTYFHLLEGAVSDLAAERRGELVRMELELAERVPGVFYRVDIVESIYPGVVSVAQSYGVGSLEANSVMLGWTQKEERREGYIQMLLDLAELNRSLFLVRFDEVRRLGRRRNIHIWWGGLQGNGGLMLLLAHLLTAHEKWRGAEVTVITVVESEGEQERANASLKSILEATRLRARPRVLRRAGRDIPTIMAEESEEADLAILGIGLPDSARSAGPFVDRINAMLEGLPSTILVHSARDFEGEPLLFDQEAGGGPEDSSRKSG